MQSAVDRREGRIDLQRQNPIGFNGALHEADGWQLLGNGRRLYNPILRRFHSPDSLSPFGKGGINAYAYCSGDPINSTDPTGAFPLATFVQALTRFKAHSQKLGQGKSPHLSQRICDLPDRLRG
jgi:RHS repeat-associated protein